MIKDIEIEMVKTRESIKKSCMIAPIPSGFYVLVWLCEVRHEMHRATLVNHFHL